MPASVATVIAEVQGGKGAKYFDEAKKQMVDMPATTVIRAAASVVNTNSEIGVTALTEAAVQRAEALAGTGGNIIPHLNTAKATVESVFGVQDILKAPALVGSTLDMANLGSSQAEQYALRLASLAKSCAKLRYGEAAPAAKMAQAIALDLADGDIDGSGNTGTLPYDLATFAAQYQAQMITLVQDLLANASQGGFDATKLQALLTFVQNNPVSLNVTPPPIPFALTGFTPVSAAVGAEVTITGTGFVADPTKMKVTFANNVMAEIISATANSLVVKVPQGAVSGKISVTNLNQNVTSISSTNFTVTPINTTGLTFGNVSYQAQTKPTGALYIPDQIVWDGSRFAGLERSRDFHNTAATAFAWLSNDGITWTRKTTDMPNQFVSMVGMNNILFNVQAGWQTSGAEFGFGSIKVFTSTDGMAWQGKILTNSGFSTSTLAGGKYLNNRYFLAMDIDCMLMTSTDASSWQVIDLKTVSTSAAVAPPSTSDFCSLPVYRNGKYFVYRGVAGVGGTFRQPDHYEAAYYSSTDGINWTFGTFMLPNGFNKISQGGRVFEVHELDDTLVMKAVTRIEYTRDTATGGLMAVTKDQQLATSQDGLNWTMANAVGVTYAPTETGKPAPRNFFNVKTTTGWLFSNQIFTAGSPTPMTTYYTTNDAVSYQASNQDFGLLGANNRIYSYSPTLKRLVVIDGGTQGNTIKIGTLDF
ncbi:MAG TPA: IPT/TIG domain-containing protein [Agitococcus sp.]|nr:IPT/TIG domain-containing protein [Agitococcus sp.]